MKILFLAYTSKYYDSSGIKIENPALTRKMSCMETWVPKIESLGHKVIFFDGSNKELSYDDDNKILHLLSNESYDYPNTGFKSFMIERLKEAVRWALSNEEFDYVFRTDDGSYLNHYVLEDLMKEINGYDALRGFGGGGGVLMSKKVCEELINFENSANLTLEDRALFTFLSRFRTKVTNSLSIQYVPGEKIFSIHYTNGKRQYFVDNILDYYYGGNPIDRKIVIDSPADYNKTSSVRSWWWENGKGTPYWYSFDKDIYNWEYYMGPSRSLYHYRQHCAFGKESLFRLMFYRFEYNLTNPTEKEIFIEHINCLKENGVAYIPDSDSYRKDIFDIFPYSEIAENIKENIELIETNRNKWILIRKHKEDICPEIHQFQQN
jgi:hypothetical protein